MKKSRRGPLSTTIIIIIIKITVVGKKNKIVVQRYVLCFGSGPDACVRKNLIDILQHRYLYSRKQSTRLREGFEIYFIHLVAISSYSYDPSVAARVRRSPVPRPDGDRISADFPCECVVHFYPDVRQFDVRVHAKAAQHFGDHQLHRYHCILHTYRSMHRTNRPNSERNSCLFRQETRTTSIDVRLNVIRLEYGFLYNRMI